jgi:hypothetical protein
MTAEDFRHVALSLPQAVESMHMGHADFRVGGKIFATLSADETTGVVMLSRDDQEELVRLHPEAFTPAAGSWGLRACTRVMLAAVRLPVLQHAMTSAWRNKAPKKIAAMHPKHR